MPKITQYHPESNLLTHYANGQLSKGLALAVETHLARCDACSKLVALRGERATHREAQNPQQAESQHSPRSPAEGLAAEFKTVELFGKAVSVPPQLASFVEQGLKWRQVTKGVHSALIDSEGESRCAIVHVEPGAVVPRHTQQRTETMQMLEGNICDDWDCYGLADFVMRGPHQEHALMAHEGCFCLVVTDGPLYFTIGLDRLKNPLIAFRYLRLRLKNFFHKKNS